MTAAQGSWKVLVVEAFKALAFHMCIYVSLVKVACKCAYNKLLKADPDNGFENYRLYLCSEEDADCRATW